MLQLRNSGTSVLPWWDWPKKTLILYNTHTLSLTISLCLSNTFGTRIFRITFFYFQLSKMSFHVMKVHFISVYVESLNQFCISTVRLYIIFSSISEMYLLLINLFIQCFTITVTQITIGILHPSSLQSSFTSFYSQLFFCCKVCWMCAICCYKPNICICLNSCTLMDLCEILKDSSFEWSPSTLLLALIVFNTADTCDTAWYYNKARSALARLSVSWDKSRKFWYHVKTTVSLLTNLTNSEAPQLYTTFYMLCNLIYYVVLFIHWLWR